MKRVDTCHTKEAIPPERDEAACPGRSSVASQSRREETPELLAGYLGRIGRDRLLTPEEELDLGRQARAEVYLKRNLVRGQIRRVSGTGGAVVDQQWARAPLASRQRTSGSWFRSSREPVAEVEP
jgi:hypothetical protein